MKCEATTVAIAVHSAGESPVFGERTTKIELDDEGAGCFIALSQDGGRITLDADEVELVFSAIKTLLAQTAAEK